MSLVGIVSRKTHLALALGVEAVKVGKSVFFATLGELVASLAKAEREGQLTQRIRFLTRNALLIIDEIGYLPITPGGANLFFQLINSRYERGSLILTSNRGFSEWGEIFGCASTSAMSWSPAHCWIACCTTPSSCRSKGKAIGCGNTHS